MIVLLVVMGLVAYLAIGVAIGRWVYRHPFANIPATGAEMVLLWGLYLLVAIGICSVAVLVTPIIKFSKWVVKFRNKGTWPDGDSDH